MRAAAWNPVGPPAWVSVLITDSGVLRPPIGPALRRAAMEGMLA